MSAYSRRIAEAARLAILSELARAPGYEANHAILRSALADVGLHTSTDTVLAHLTWLDEQGLITVRDIDPFRVARLTERGRDVAEGLSVVPGVAQPEP